MILKKIIINNNAVVVCSMNNIKVSYKPVVHYNCRRA